MMVAKQFFGRMDIGEWESEDGGLILSPVQLKEQSTVFKWKPLNDPLQLWPHLEDKPLRYFQNPRGE